jgi:hypothetical protein
VSNDGTVVDSGDDGATFSAVPTSLQPPPTWLSVWGGGGGVFLAGTAIVRSANAGASWTTELDPFTVNQVTA